MSRNPVVPSLFASDLPATIEYYTETLGFTVTGRYEQDGKLTWAELSLGNSTLWFFSHPIDDRPRPAMSGMIYIFVDDVGAIADRLRDRVAFRWGPETQPYGLRDLGVEDPDGYLLVFARDT